MLFTFVLFLLLGGGCLTSLWAAVCADWCLYVERGCDVPVCLQQPGLWQPHHVTVVASAVMRAGPEQLLYTRRLAFEPEVAPAAAACH